MRFEEAVWIGRRRVVAFRGGPEATRARAHRLLWLTRPYLSSAVVLRVR